MLQSDITIAKKAAWRYKRGVLRADAPAIEQAVLLGVWLARQKFDGRGNLRGFTAQKIFHEVVNEKRRWSFWGSDRDRPRRIPPLPLDEARFVCDPRSNEDYVDARVSLPRLLGRLTSSERDIIHRRFFRGEYHYEIARDYGVCASQIVRICNRALAKMRV